MTNDLVKRLRMWIYEYEEQNAPGPWAPDMSFAADRIEALEAALREKDNIAYIIDRHGISHNTFTIVYKGKSDD